MSVVLDPSLVGAIDAPRPRMSGMLLAGVGLFGVIIVIAIVGPAVLPSPTEVHLNNILAPPSRMYPLGTDQLGRDVLSRVVSGLRIDLLIGVTALLVPLLVGTVLGAIAGWRGRWTDHAVGITADVVQAFPYYLLIIVLVFFLGAGVVSIFVAVALVAWVSYMRIVRAGVQSAMRRDYVAAALGGGLSSTRVMVRHVLPNVVGQPIAYFATDVVVVIVSTATLSFFGLGVAPPAPELGNLIADGQQFIGVRPLLSVAPGLAVVIMGAALSLIGNGLAEQLDAPHG